MSDYEHDFYEWTQAQAAAIRAGAWGAVDRAHLAEEVEDVGKSERRALVSHLRVLLMHLLKWEYQGARRSDSWVHSMVNAQVELQAILDDSPSLYREVPALVARAYDQACRVAGLEIKRPRAFFPSHCPWSVDALLLPEWLVDKLGIDPQ